MQIYLSLGSNLDNPRRNLRQAIGLLEQYGFRRIRVSPTVETPALLPEGAPADWNRPFLNLVMQGETDFTPAQLRERITTIQSQIGRGEGSRWSPRKIDIDILLWGEERVVTPDLTIPHPDMHARSFVVSPLLFLAPHLTVPGLGAKRLIDWSHELSHHIPLWMGILNVTPDSFSDGGEFVAWERIEPHVDAMVHAGAHIIDVGAESTRPGATPINAAEEWARLAPLLARLVEKFHDDPLRPLISLDTYHPQVAQRGLEAGVDIINDVSGLTSPQMRELAQAGDKDWIAMHHVTIPASKAHTLPPDCDPAATVERWLMEQMEAWDKAGLNLERLIFDPGVGFGKDELQSLQLLRHAGRFRRHGLRVLIGHSRKSFMENLGSRNVSEKDQVTVGASLNLCAQGVDIIRVHNVSLHTTAYRGWSHLVAT